MHILWVLLGAFLVSSQAFAVREIQEANGTYYFEEQSGQVYSCVRTESFEDGKFRSQAYCVSMDHPEFGHPIQLEPAQPGPSYNLGLPPSAQPYSPPISGPQQRPSTEDLLKDRNYGTGGASSSGLTFNAGERQIICQHLNNLFGPGVPRNNFEGIRKQANAFEAGKAHNEKVKLALSEPQRWRGTLQVGAVSSLKREIISLPSIPDPQDSDLPYQFKSQGETKKELKRLYKHLYKIDPNQGKRKDAKEMGLIAVQEADQGYAQGKFEDGQFYKELAEGFLDVAIGLDPVTGLGRSTYELFMGRNFVTGAKLDNLDRSLAFLSVVTLGSGRSIAVATRGMWKVFNGASRLLQERKVTAAATAAIREGEALAVQAGNLLVGMKHSRVINIHTAESANRIFPSHWTLRPFQFRSHVVEFVTGRESQWVRVHQGVNEGREWIMRKSAIRGLTPEQIMEKFALPQLPTHISDVLVPKGTRMLRGNVGNVAGKTAGAIQCYLIDIERSWFKNMRAL
jgi:hypothetical protein